MYTKFTSNHQFMIGKGSIFLQHHPQFIEPNTPFYERVHLVINF